MLRTYGSRGFDIEAMEATELERRCEAWARHILTGTPAPLGEEEPEEQEKTESITMDQHHWADLQRFFRRHRRDEQAAVHGSAEGMRGLIGELTSGLRSAVSDDNAKDDMVTRERQARYEAQLQSMGERVHTLRADLVAVREKVNLDALTRLHNRGAFDEVLAKQIDFSFPPARPWS